MSGQKMKPVPPHIVASGPPDTKWFGGAVDPHAGDSAGLRHAVCFDQRRRWLRTRRSRRGDARAQSAQFSSAAQRPDHRNFFRRPSQVHPRNGARADRREIAGTSGVITQARPARAIQSAAGASSPHARAQSPPSQHRKCHRLRRKYGARDRPAASARDRLAPHCPCPSPRSATRRHTDRRSNPGNTLPTVSAASFDRRVLLRDEPPVREPAAT